MGSENIQSHACTWIDCRQLFPLRMPPTAPWLSASKRFFFFILHFSYFLLQKHSQIAMKKLSKSLRERKFLWHFFSRFESWANRCWWASSWSTWKQGRFQHCKRACTFFRVEESVFFHQELVAVGELAQTNSKPKWANVWPKTNKFKPQNGTSLKEKLSLTPQEMPQCVVYVTIQGIHSYPPPFETQPSVIDSSRFDQKPCLMTWQ